MDPLAIAGAILVGLVGTAIWEAGVRAYRYKNSRAPLRTFYRFGDHHPIFVLQSALAYNKDGEFFAYTTAIDGVFAYQMIFAYLIDIRFPKERINLKFAPEAAQADMDDNLILVGGYENNRISSNLNNSNGRLFYFEENTILQKGLPKTETGWGAGVDANGRIIRDYCLVTRIPNPWRTQNSNSVIVAFEGVRHFGTLGGVKFMNADNLRNQIKLFGCRLSDATILEIVISCDVGHLENGGFVLSNEKVEAVAVDGARVV